MPKESANRCVVPHTKGAAGDQGRRVMCDYNTTRFHFKVKSKLLEAKQKQFRQFMLRKEHVEHQVETLRCLEAIVVHPTGKEEVVHHRFNLKELHTFVDDCLKSHDCVKFGTVVVQGRTKLSHTFVEGTRHRYTSVLFHSPQHSVSPRVTNWNKACGVYGTVVLVPSMHILEAFEECQEKFENWKKTLASERSIVQDLKGRVDKYAARLKQLQALQQQDTL